MPDSEIDLRGMVLSLFDQGLGGKSLILAHSQGAPDSLKREVVDLLIKKDFASVSIGKGKGRSVGSEMWIRSQSIDEFFRACYIFRGRVKDMPDGFIIGRTYIGTPIILRLNKKVWNGLWYDESYNNNFK